MKKNFGFDKNNII